MRIAICFSGQIRTGVHAATNIKNFIGDLMPDCDFFVHTWDISQCKEWAPDSVKSIENGSPKYHPVEDGNILLDGLRRAYDNKLHHIKIENFDKWNKTFLTEYKDFSPLWYSWYQSVLLKKQFEQSNNFKYDAVVKMRFDTIFPAYRKLSRDIDHFLTDPIKFYALGYAPIRIDDVFFLSNSDIMDKASSMIIEVQDKAWKTNTFGEFLNSQQIICYNTYDTLYTVLRPESIKILDFNKCFNIERDYYAPYNTYRLPENE